MEQHPLRRNRSGFGHQNLPNPPRYVTLEPSNNVERTNQGTNEKYSIRVSEDSNEPSSRRWVSCFWRRGRDRNWKNDAPNWKPVTLRAPVLGGFITVAIVLILVLELLSYISGGNGNANGGGLVFATTIDDIGPLAMFGYLYLPTILAVFYSMLWSWVELDTKRLEPWFQMSKPEGACAEDSLLLRYPAEFLAFVPIHAAKRRHWAVFLAGMIIMFVAWVIVPLQSAIFSTGTILRTREIPMTSTAEILSVPLQTTSLNESFMSTAYGVSWLNQSLPPFTTRTSAMLPFSPIINDGSIFPKETWSSRTTAYSTNLTCTPAIISNDSTTTYTFDNGRGCSISQIGLPGAKASHASHLVLYIQYYENAFVDIALQNPNCTLESSNNFLALWASALTETEDGLYNDLTGLFCEPSYYVENVSATVNAIDLSVSNIESIAQAGNTSISKLSPDVFNITNFEYLIGTGVSAVTSRGDIQYVSAVEQYPRLLNYSLAWPVSNMVGFAIAINLAPVDSLGDAVNMHASFEKAHQLLFSMAISSLMIPRSSTTTMIGSVQDQPNAIILVRSFAIVVEAFLAVVAVLTSLLWYMVRSRPSQMSKDPACIGDIMEILHNSRDIQGSVVVTDNLPGSHSGDELPHPRFRLSTRSEYGVKKMHLDVFNDISGKTMPPLKHKSNFTGAEAAPIHQLVLRWPIGAVLVLALAAALAVVVILNFQSIRGEGIIRPSSSTFILSILENLVPIAFTSLLEPFWVYLNRLLCILQPFEQLRRGNAKVETSIRVKYTSLPPQLAMWRAFRSRHYLLAIICLIAISTNGLAVALSGLFNETSIEVALPMDMSYKLSPVFDGIPNVAAGQAGVPITFLDHFYVVLANMSHGTSLPPWVDANFFYIPFELPEPAMSTADIEKNDLSIQAYQATTRGFGVNTTCKPLSTDGLRDTITFNITNQGVNIDVYTQHVLETGEQITCVPLVASFNGSFVVGQYTNEPSAMEVISAMGLPIETPSQSYNGSFCNSLLISGWVRLGAAVPSTTAFGTNGTEGRSLETAFVSCVSTLQTAEFDIIVDLNGRVLSSNQTTSFDTDLSPFANSTEVSALLAQIPPLLAPYTPNNVVWHTDNITSSWMSALLTGKLKSHTLVSPAVPIPDIEFLASTLESLSQTLAATILSLNTNIFVPISAALTNTPAVTSGQILTEQTRIFISPILFIITVALLSLHLATAIAFYAFRPLALFAEIPVSIADIIKLVEGSNAVASMGNGVQEDSKGVEAKGERFGYGKFTGTDGKERVGIEKAPFVMTLTDAELRMRRIPGQAGFQKQQKSNKFWHGNSSKMETFKVMDEPEWI